MEVRHVDPSALSLVLRRLRRVRKAAVEAKVTSMRSKGQLSALVASEHEGQLVVIDGFARQQAALRLGMKQVAVRVLQLTPVQMKAQMYLRNWERGGETRPNTWSCQSSSSRAFRTCTESSCFEKGFCMKLTPSSSTP